VLASLAGSRAPDAALISGTRMLRPAVPSLTVGLRSSLAHELTISGPPNDLHSGAFGGAVHNPLQVLYEVLSTLHPREGRSRARVRTHVFAPFRPASARPA
jgi:acetylornithine deacetylase/succinyl-diaminopimelate desuccinylase-like protein